MLSVETEEGKFSCITSENANCFDDLIEQEWIYLVQRDSALPKSLKDPSCQWLHHL